MKSVTHYLAAVVFIEKTNNPKLFDKLTVKPEIIKLLYEYNSFEVIRLIML